MLNLAMPSLGKLEPMALWAVLGLAMLHSFAAASGDSSSEDGGGNASSSEDTDDALGNNSSTEYFSVPAFFITFRETIEVSVVLRTGICREDSLGVHAKIALFWHTLRVPSLDQCCQAASDVCRVACAHIDVHACDDIPIGYDDTETPSSIDLSVEVMC